MASLPTLLTMPVRQHIRIPTVVDKEPHPQIFQAPLPTQPLDRAVPFHDAVCGSACRGQSPPLGENLHQLDVTRLEPTLEVHRCAFEDEDSAE